MTLGRILSRIPLLVLAVALPALAGRPLTVDDAAIVAEKACQVESWIDRTKDTTAGWFVPSCNFGLNTEWQLGFVRARGDNGTRFSDEYAQAKLLVREMTDSEPWGVGLTAGILRHPLNEKYTGWGNAYVIVPFSQKICNTPFLVHANLGWTRDKEQRKDVVLWGAAVEADVNERLTLLGEVFDDNLGKAFVRMGGRWTARPRLDFDLSFAARPRGPSQERLVSVGVTWQSDAFMR